MASREMPGDLYYRRFPVARRPFTAASESGFFAGAERDSAVTALLHGVRDRRGLSVLVGELGVGKTTLLDRLTGELSAQASVVRLGAVALTPEELQRRVLEALTGKARRADGAKLKAALSQALRDAEARERPVVLMIDDAHDWDETTLGSLARLLELPGASHRALQAVIAGEPRLLRLLAGQACRDLSRAIAVKRQLLPFSREETRRFLARQLELAGGSSHLFEADAYRRVFEVSRGLPGDLVRVCEAAMSRASAADRVRVLATDVPGEVPQVRVAAAPDTVAVEPVGAGGRTGRSRWLGVTAAAAVAVGVLVGVGLWRLAAGPPDEEGNTVAQDDVAVPGVAPAVEVPSDSSRLTTEVRREASGDRLIEVVRGATVYDLMLDVYGRYSPALLAEVERANPELADIDFILPGQLLRFPSPPGDLRADGSAEPGAPRVESSY